MLSTKIFLIYTLFELVSLPMALRIIWILITDKKLNTPFHRLFCIIGILELCHYLINVLFYRLPMLEPLISHFEHLGPSRLLSVPLFLNFFLTYPMLILHVAICLNRFTGVWMPFQHKRIWSNSWQWVTISAFALSFLLTFHRLFAISEFVPLIDGHPEKGRYPIITHFILFEIDQLKLSVVFLIVSVLSSIPINALTLAKIVQLKSANTWAHPSAQKVELNLFIVATWLTLSLLLWIVFQSMYYAIWAGFLDGSSLITLDLLFQWQPLIEDLGCLVPLWLLVLVNRPVRCATLPFEFIYKMN